MHATLQYGGPSMRIEWKIEKKRGNLRPELRYSVNLEDHEKALALPPVRITSTIPKPEEHHQDYCYPEQFERDGQSAPESNSFHVLESPSHKGHSWMQSLRLPWREDCEYPEVEESFLLLREAFEKELTAAYGSAPMDVTKELLSSSAARKNIAPGILAERFLNIVHKGVSQTG